MTKQFNLFKQGMALQAQSIGKKLEDYQPPIEKICLSCGRKHMDLQITCNACQRFDKEFDSYGHSTFDPRKP